MDRTGASTAKFRVPAACFLVAGVLVFALYRESLSLWWLGDDPALLRFAAEHAPWAGWIDREAVRALPWHVAAPLQLTAYDLDLTLFGPDPRKFQLHHLAILATAIAAVAIVARRFWEWWPAVAAGAVFAVGAPVAGVAAERMARHYAAGLALAAIAAGLWRAAVNRDADRQASRGGRCRAWAGAGVYLLAAASKEVFVPLPFLLPFLPTSGPTALHLRLRAAAPFALGLAVYMAWRTWLLGTPTGGYGFTAAAAEWPAQVPELVRELGRRFFATGVDGLALALAASGAGILLLALSPRRLPGLAAGTALVLAPIVPLAGALSPRHLLLPWLAFVAWIAAGAIALTRTEQREGGARRFAQRAAALALLVLAFGAAWSQGRVAWAEAMVRGEREGAEGRFVMTHVPRDLLALPEAPGHYLFSVAELRRSWSGGESPGWFSDELFLCMSISQKGGFGEASGADPWAGKRVWAWRSGDAFADITADMARVRSKACGRIREDLPFEVELEVPVAGGRIDWRLSAPSRGGWAFVFDDGVDRVRVPARGSFATGSRRALALRVRFETSDGWIGYSPELRLALRPGERRSWRWSPEEDGR